MTRSASSSLTIAQMVWLGAAWLVPTIVLGVPYLSAEYSELESTGVVWGWGLLVLVAVALLVCAVGRTPMVLTALATTAGLLTVVWVRIWMDVAVDPTDHNLWPFEIVIAAGLGGIASAAGAMVGAGIGRLVQAR